MRERAKKKNQQQHRLPAEKKKQFISNDDLGKGRKNMERKIVILFCTCVLFLFTAPMTAKIFIQKNEMKNPNDDEMKWRKENILCVVM